MTHHDETTDLTHHDETMDLDVENRPGFKVAGVLKPIVAGEVTITATTDDGDVVVAGATIADEMIADAGAATTAEVHAAGETRAAVATRVWHVEAVQFSRPRK